MHNQEENEVAVTTVASNKISKERGKSTMENGKKSLNIRKIKKQVKGITLIALVVTIIVLLILAGIALNLTIGQNGIFSRAQTAANTWRNAETNEQLAMGELDKLIGNYLGENGSQGSGGGDDQTETTVVDGVPIPDGFYYVGGAKDTGLIISDNPADENKYSPEKWEDQANIPAGKETDENGAIIGNQFVWVPVENPDLFQRYDGYTGGMLESDFVELLGISNFWELLSEPLSSSDWETAEYNLMRTSVINNKGFYVARYEASQSTGSEAESKPGAMPWVNIPWGTSMTEVGNSGAVYKAQNMYNDSEHAVTSTLIYGVQWDAIMNFIDPNYSKEDGTCNSFVSNSTGKGNYNEDENTNSWKNNLTSCGSSDDYRVKNIYDLAGNVFEWTMEIFSTGERVPRGGYFYGSGSEYTVSYRSVGYPDNYEIMGFRVTLYL